MLPNLTKEEQKIVDRYMELTDAFVVYDVTNGIYMISVLEDTYNYSTKYQLLADIKYTLEEFEKEIGGVEDEDFSI